MTEIWTSLVVNLMVVALFISMWAHAQYWFATRIRPVRHLAFGLTMGLGVVASMSLAIEFQPGVIFDLRAPLLAIAGFFGGPLGAIVALVLAGGFRLWLAGTGVWGGLISMTLSAGLGVAGYLLVARNVRPYHVALLALAVGGTVVVAILMLPADMAAEAMASFAGPVIVLTIAATLMSGLIVLKSKRMASERHMLKSAIAQAPDFAYVKDPAGAFVAVNNQVAAYNGFARPEDMIGKTDRDLTDPVRAQALWEQEQRVIATGEPLMDAEERVDADGRERWFSTSKVPVRDEEGRVIGLIGVTRDITASRKLERDLIDSRNLMAFAMSEMADGLAMFGRDGYLIFCNDRYRSAFPLTAHIRREGAHIREILAEVVRTGEQERTAGLSPKDWMAWVETSLKTGGEEQVHLYDGRWLHLRTRVTEAGASMVVVSDVTSIKQSEEHLLSLTGELRKLASTDGLTGLMNRRMFDQTLEEAISRSSALGTDLSLLMVDVDHFKAFNDTYGHPAGDECLRVVGRCLKKALRQSEDVVARYGGEEFAAILDMASEDEAFQAAERIRKGLLDLAVPHGGSPRHVVTVSIGIASYSGPGARSAPQLIARADEALYEAKTAGRNRSTGWQARQADRMSGVA